MDPNYDDKSVEHPQTTLDSNLGEEIDYSIADALPPQHPKSSENDDDDNITLPADDFVDEKKNLKKTILPKKPNPLEEDKVSLLQLFRFANRTDRLLIFLGTVGAAGNGSAVPLMTIIFASIIQAFLDFSINTSIKNIDRQTARDQLNSDIRKYSLFFVALGVGVFLLAYAQISFWMLAGERQAKVKENFIEFLNKIKIRQLYFAAVLRQDISWFDSVATGDVISRISSDVTVLQDGISEKVAGIIQYLCTFITGFIIAFTKGWKLALVLCAIFPLLAGAGIFMAKSLSSYATKGQDAYAEAGTVVEQVFSSIKTIAAFGGQQREADRYLKKLDESYSIGKKQGLITGAGVGSIMFIIFATYALAFFYGAKLVVNGDLTGGQVVNVFFAILLGAFALGNASPNFAAVGSALGAAAKLYAVIDRVPQIDVQSEQGTKIDKSSVRGRIEFKDINFYYPSRPNVQVLKNFNLTIEAGETVALVGSSGSGKSTIVGLMERFYDPVEGSIILDGQNTKHINIKSLRKNIGLVGQEPVLFPVSIRENIEWGAVIDGSKPSLDEIIAACKKSNAHTFIQELPQKYETNVGEKGALLSGGQKQRIAIARALIKDPAILLLDEATSALDTESESLVQDALDVASTNRTTIVVAHRLSTIKDADKIVVMAKGEIVEIGKHEELIARQGLYYSLVKAQELKTKDQEAGKQDDEDSADEEEGEVKISIGRQVTRMTTKGSSIKSILDVHTQEEEDFSKMKTPWGRVIRLSRPEYPLIAIGLFGSILMGVIMPLFSLIYSTILEVYSKTDDPDELKRKANFWAGMFAILSVVAWVGYFCKIAFFEMTANRLTRRLRFMTFTSLLKQEIAFFDDERNATGVLTSKLAVEATEVQGLVAVSGTIVQIIASMTGGLLIAFINGWKLTIVVLAAAPALGFASYLELKSHAGFGAKTSKAYEDSGQIVQQSVSNMRTIAALSREETFNRLYEESIAGPHKIAVRGIFVSSIGFGLSQGLQFCVWALAFWYGGKLLGDGEYQLKKMLNVLFAVIFTAQSLGQMSMFAPNTAKAKIAAISIFKLFDRKSSIDPTDTEGKIRPAPVTGECSIEKAYFNYPARRNVKILRGLDANILAGKRVAIVGPSGCGKSTVVALLLRYYDVASGEVNAERTNVKDWNVEYLRSNMALVGQEPVLFDLTIGENIAYGKEGCSQEEIEEAAKKANIHNFIMSLPLQYDTSVGEKGTQLSGGQKQRVAIARALIRNPKLLLLDEATSALDSESEKVVQNALDRASKGRTTITIAHRLSTIQNSDLILVFRKGKVQESGTHLELISQKGLYHDLVTRQRLMKET
ncbi:hypothetical protein G9A89_007009 [Geosiphon pyriformis]|nr:hypothetical protein G9A89_007009 [Geosiphon pyriformis]